jgi:hypothetical protein
VAVVALAMENYLMGVQYVPLPPCKMVTETRPQQYIHSGNIQGVYIITEHLIFGSYVISDCIEYTNESKKELRGFGSLTNYGDRATAASWRSSTKKLVLPMSQSVYYIKLKTLHVSVLVDDLQM